jgi:hypothetical protein
MDRNEWVNGMREFLAQAGGVVCCFLVRADDQDFARELGKGNKQVQLLWMIVRHAIDNHMAELCVSCDASFGRKIPQGYLVLTPGMEPDPDNRNSVAAACPVCDACLTKSFDELHSAVIGHLQDMVPNARIVAVEHEAGHA